VLSEALSNRERVVLESLVHAYVDNGTPVGSSTLSKREGFEFSPATVRKALASLEEKGYVSQPHTSAGRQPTDKGYRYYVEQTVGYVATLSPEEGESVRRRLELFRQEGRVDEIHGQLAEVVGGVSHQLGIVLAPRFESGVVEHLDLVRLTETRLLMVATIQQGPVKSLVLEVSSRVSRRELEAVRQLLNERLAGLDLDQIQTSARERVESLSVGNPQLLRLVVDELESLSGNSGDALHVAGTRNIFLQPEFRDSLEIAGLMDLVERKDPLADFLSGREGVMVTIGEENEVSEMRCCSVVTASYEANGATGIIGVIGPTRMPYERLLALVDYTAFRAAELVS
jgi:heat-inducible transcriptional repressor